MTLVRYGLLLLALLAGGGPGKGVSFFGKHPTLDAAAKTSVSSVRQSCVVEPVDEFQQKTNGPCLEPVWDRVLREAYVNIIFEKFNRLFFIRTTATAPEREE